MSVAGKSYMEIERGLDEISDLVGECLTTLGFLRVDANVDYLDRNLVSIRDKIAHLRN
jgi:hypothetical protein